MFDSTLTSTLICAAPIYAKGSHLVMVAVMLLYIPLFLPMYLHMFGQRKKVLGKKKEA